jgi:hypothetical protein
MFVSTTDEMDSKEKELFFQASNISLKHKADDEHQLQY